MKPYVEKDCVKSVVLWNPVDLGYAATYVLRAAADGTLKPGATSVKAGKLGDLQVVNGSRDPARRALHLQQGQYRPVRLLSRVCHSASGLPRRQGTGEMRMHAKLNMPYKPPASHTSDPTQFRDVLEMTDAEIRDRLAVIRALLIEHGIDPLGLPIPRGNGEHQ